MAREIRLLGLLLALWTLPVQAQGIGPGHGRWPGQGRKEAEEPTDPQGRKALLERRIAGFERALAAAPGGSSGRAGVQLKLAHLHWELAQTCESPPVPAQGESAEELERAFAVCRKQHAAAAVKTLETLSQATEAATIRDEVLFYQGYYLAQMGEVKRAQALMRQVVEDFPESSFVPEAWLLLGEIHFDRTQLADAAAAYRKVAAHPRSPMVPYALYKLAWVQFNLQEYEAALKTLADVVQRTTQKLQWPRIRDQALRDLGLFFAQVGDPERALEYFQEVAGDEAERLTAHLAAVYADQGRFPESNTVLHQLLARFPDSAHRLAWHRLLVLNASAMGRSEAVVAETEALVKAVETMRKRHAEQVAKQLPGLVESLNVLLRQYRLEGQHNPEARKVAAELERLLGGLGEESNE